MNPKDNDELRRELKDRIDRYFDCYLAEDGVLINDIMHLISTHTLRARKDELEHVKDGCIVAEDEPYTTINGKEMPISERIAQIDTEIKKLGA